MKDLEFIGIEDRGAGPAAVFRNFDREFCLIHSGLETRIANLERQKVDTSVERYALAQMSAATQTAKE